MLLLYEVCESLVGILGGLDQREGLFDLLGLPFPGKDGPSLEEVGAGSVSLFHGFEAYLLGILLGREGRNNQYELLLNVSIQDRHQRYFSISKISPLFSDRIILTVIPVLISYYG